MGMKIEMNQYSKHFLDEKFRTTKILMQETEIDKFSITKFDWSRKFWIEV